MAKISIRDASPENEERLIEIFEKANENSDDEYLRNQFINNLPTKIIESKEDIVGYCWEMMGSGNDRYIISPTFLPKYGSKMKKSFLKAVQKQVKAGAGVYKTLNMSVKINQEDNEMVKLLEKLGFEESGKSEIRGQAEVNYTYSP